MGTSSLWKIPAARAASTSVFSKTSEKCSSQPAPLEAITGIDIASLTCLASSISKPLLVPSLSIVGINQLDEANKERINVAKR